MTSLLIILTLCILPPAERTGLATDSVDEIHLNHVYDETAREILTQYLFRERTESGFRIRAWRLDRGAHVSRHPSGDYVLLWHDGDLLREVRARTYRESWTQHDPELRERSLYPKDMRAELWKPHDEPDELDLIFP